MADTTKGEDLILAKLDTVIALLNKLTSTAVVQDKALDDINNPKKGSTTRNGV